MAEKSHIVYEYILKKERYKFSDLHVENIMKSKNGKKYYIIDTNVEIPEQQEQSL